MICFYVYLLCIKRGGAHDLEKQKFKAQTQKIRRGWFSAQDAGIKQAGLKPGERSGPGIGEELVVLRDVQELLGNVLWEEM